MADKFEPRKTVMFCHSEGEFGYADVILSQRYSNSYIELSDTGQAIRDLRPKVGDKFKVTIEKIAKWPEK